MNAILKMVHKQTKLAVHVILNILELKLKFDTKVELRSLPHLFHR
jgi:hypothetical protein